MSQNWTTWASHCHCQLMFLSSLIWSQALQIASVKPERGCVSFTCWYFRFSWDSDSSNVMMMSECFVAFHWKVCQKKIWYHRWQRWWWSNVWALILGGVFVFVFVVVFVFVFVMKEKKLKMSDCLVAYSVMALAVACSAIVGIPQPSAAPPIPPANQQYYTANSYTPPANQQARLLYWHVLFTANCCCEDFFFFHIWGQPRSSVLNPRSSVLGPPLSLIISILSQPRFSVLNP